MTNSAIILNESFRLMKEGILSGSGRYVVLDGKTARKRSSYRKISTPSRHGRRAVLSSVKANMPLPLFTYGSIQTAAAQMLKKVKQTENGKAADGAF